MSDTKNRPALNSTNCPPGFNAVILGDARKAQSKRIRVFAFTVVTTNILSKIAVKPRNGHPAPIIVHK